MTDILDIFKKRPFSATSMTEHISKNPYAPGRLGEAGIFTTKSVRTTTIWLTLKDGKLSLIPTTPRGAPLPQNVKDMRDAVAFQTYRVAKGDRVMASEIQDVLATGSENATQTMQTEIDERMQQLQSDMELTREYHRMGAINGLVLDADAGNTELVNMWDKFGIVQPAAVNFAFATSTLAELRVLADGVKKDMFYASKGAWISSKTGVTALMGDSAWTSFITNAGIEKTYINTAEASKLRDEMVDRYQAFGITWERYWGTEDDTVGVADNEIRFVPTQTNGAFQEIYSPAEFAPFVNKPGKREYAMVIPDTKRQQHVDVELYAYPLTICTRPEMLRRGVAS